MAASAQAVQLALDDIATVRGAWATKLDSLASATSAASAHDVDDASTISFIGSVYSTQVAAAGTAGATAQAALRSDGTWIPQPEAAHAQHQDDTTAALSALHEQTKAAIADIGVALASLLRKGLTDAAPIATATATTQRGASSPASPRTPLAMHDLDRSGVGNAVSDATLRQQDLGDGAPRVGMQALNTSGILRLLSPARGALAAAALNASRSSAPGGGAALESVLSIISELSAKHAHEIEQLQERNKSLVARAEEASAALTAAAAASEARVEAILREAAAQRDAALDAQRRDAEAHLRAALAAETARADKAAGKLKTLREEFLTLAQDADQRIADEAAKRSAAEAAAAKLDAAVQRYRARIATLQERCDQLAGALQLTTTTLRMAESKGFSVSALAELHEREASNLRFILDRTAASLGGTSFLESSMLSTTVGGGGGAGSGGGGVN
ncbi:MAG: hypothetical protein EOO41_04125, partial [Methanobacteriota archaeon]